MQTLRAEYENGGGSSTFVAQIDWLMSRGWTHIRRAKGDGDCFYRCKISMFLFYVVLRGKAKLWHLHLCCEY